MADPRISLKNRWLAGLLAWLVPGAGHFYQGRMFKGAIFFVCILGMYLYGMQLADWKAAYASEAEQRFANKKSVKWGFVAQAGVGGPSALVYLQSRRFFGENNVTASSIDKPLSTTFRGRFRPDNDDRNGKNVRGTLNLQPEMMEFGMGVRGQFTGSAISLDDQGNEVSEPITLELAGGVDLDPPLAAENGRLVRVEVVQPVGDAGAVEVVGILVGSMPRPFVDRAGMPMTEIERQRANGEMGKWYDLALVYTWIAGFLNILAIWDAVDGPAYGYGDEEEDEEGSAAGDDGKSAAD